MRNNYSIGIDKGSRTNSKGAIAIYNQTTDKLIKIYIINSLFSKIRFNIDMFYYKYFKNTKFYEETN